MDRELELHKRRGTRVLLIVLSIWGLAVAVAAQAGIFRAIYPILLAPIIALGIVVPVVVYAMSGGLSLPELRFEPQQIFQLKEGPGCDAHRKGCSNG